MVTPDLDTSVVFFVTSEVIAEPRQAPRDVRVDYSKVIV